MKVDPSKKYVTRAGRKVDGLFIDRSSGVYCVQGLIGREVYSWAITGKYLDKVGGDHHMDLIEVKEKKVAKKTAKKPVKKAVSRKRSVPKEPMVVSMEKCYETANCHEVCIYRTDGGGRFTVHGAYRMGSGWEATQWDGNGLNISDESLCLVEVPKRVTVAHWVNILQCEGGEYASEGYGSESDAIAAGKSLAMDETLFARVKVEVKCSQGEGL